MIEAFIKTLEFYSKLVIAVAILYCLMIFFFFFFYISPATS
jgi:hypothetical protein